MRKNKKSGSVTLHDLLFLALVALGALMGLKYGLRWGWTWGREFGSVAGVATAGLGAVVGVAAGGGVGVGVMFVLLFAGQKFDALGNWAGRKLAPRRSSAQISETALMMWLGGIGAAAGAGLITLRIWKGWEFLDGPGIALLLTGLLMAGFAALEKIQRYRIERKLENANTHSGQPNSCTNNAADHTSDQMNVEVPDWTIPAILTILIATPSFVFFLIGPGLGDPLAPWFIGGCGLTGFIGGMIAVFVHNRPALRAALTSAGQAIGFVGFKLIGLFLGGLAIGVWVWPPEGQTHFENFTVSLVTGGLSLIAIFVNGFSWAQFRRDELTGLNGRLARLSLLGLALAALGFLLMFLHF